VEFGVEIGGYRAVVRVPRRVFQRLLPERPTPERCIEASFLQRTRFESIAERKLRRHQLTEDGNIEISGRDLVSPKWRAAKSLGASQIDPKATFMTSARGWSRGGKADVRTTQSPAHASSVSSAFATFSRLPCGRNCSFSDRYRPAW
jgi:hypothetical protein